MSGQGGILVLIVSMTTNDQAWSQVSSAWMAAVLTQGFAFKIDITGVITTSNYVDPKT